MSQSPSADEDSHREGDDKCTCDGCYFTPRGKEFSYIRIDCKKNEEYRCIEAKELYVKCNFCNLEHGVNTHVLETKNGQRIYGFSVEQLEATLAKKDEEIANSHASIRQLTELLHAAKEAELVDREETSGDVTPPVVKKSRKRRMDPNEEASEAGGVDLAGNEGSGGHRDLTSDSSHPDDAAVSNRETRSSTFERLHERFLMLKTPVESMDEEEVVKEEMADEDQGEDSAERLTAAPETEEIDDRDPRNAKRARRG